MAPVDIVHGDPDYENATSLSTQERPDGTIELHPGSGWYKDARHL